MKRNYKFKLSLLERKDCDTTPPQNENLRYFDYDLSLHTSLTVSYFDKKKINCYSISFYIRILIRIIHSIIMKMFGISNKETRLVESNRKLFRYQRNMISLRLQRWH